MPDLSSLDTPRNRILSILLLCLVLGIWQGSSAFLNIPAFILPSATAVAQGLWRGTMTTHSVVVHRGKSLAAFSGYPWTVDGSCARRSR